MQSRFSAYLDSKDGVSGGLATPTGMAKLFDAMKGEIDPDAKVYEMKLLSLTRNKEAQDEFLHKGGVAILVQWAKEIKADQSPKGSRFWHLRKDTLAYMI